MSVEGAAKQIAPKQSLPSGINRSISSMTSPIVSRRRFLSQTAGLAAATAFGPNLLLRGRDAASKRLNIAVIGALGKGEVDTGKVALDHNIVALVDIDSERLGKAQTSWEKKLCAAGQSAPQPP